MISHDLFNPEPPLTPEAHAAQQRAAYVAGLKREREGYEATGNEEGVAAVDAELERLRADRATPARAERATRKPPETRSKP